MVMYQYNVEVWTTEGEGEDEREVKLSMYYDRDRYGEWEPNTVYRDGRRDDWNDLSQHEQERLTVAVAENDESAY